MPPAVQFKNEFRRVGEIEQQNDITAPSLTYRVVVLDQELLELAKVGKLERVGVNSAPLECLLGRYYARHLPLSLVTH